MRPSFPVKPSAILALAALLSFILPLPAAARTSAGQVPNLNVAGSCRAARIFGTTDPKKTYDNCMADERRAKQELAKHWTSYKAATRRDCRAAGAYPHPSYVELLTCIQMTEEVLHPPKGGFIEGGGGAIRGGRGAGALGSPSPRPALSPGPRAMPR